MADEICDADKVWNGVPKAFIGVYGTTDIAEMTPLGGTTGGVTINTTMEVKEVKIDGLLAAVRSIPVSQGMTATATFLELTLEHLQKFWNQAATSLASDGKSLALGNAQEIYYSLAFVIENTQLGISRTFWFWKVQPDGNTEMAYTQDTETGLAVTFKMHMDCTKPMAQKFGLIVDADIPVTPVP